MLEPKNSTVAESEFLNPTELAELTGYKHIAAQRDWLKKNGWTYVENAYGRPIVGRYFARTQLSGTKTTMAVSSSISRTKTWMPDFSQLEMR